MNVLIILPNWLGDAVMATPAIELLCENFPDAKLTFVGSYVSIQALKHHPFCVNAVIDETKKSTFRVLATRKLAKSLGQFDLAISFRNQIHSSLLLKFTKAKISIARASWHADLLLNYSLQLTQTHLVQQYSALVETIVNKGALETPELRLFIKPHEFKKPTLGINPGATYGSAKRWYPQEFAKVASYFSEYYDIVIFGGPTEVDMAKNIEEELIKLGALNFENIAGKTTIDELCSHIAGLSLFVTNDSGPMHVAAAYQVPTAAIFGPTRFLETCQWNNKKSVLIRHEMECSPCMKRECPLKHHECMTQIKADEVIEEIKKLIS